MSDNTMDRLEIQVQTQAQKANSDLDKMINKLERMSGSLSRINSGGIKNLASGIDKLSVSMKSISDVKTKEFSNLATNIGKLGNVNSVGINNTANALRTIASSLTATSGMSNSAVQITALANSISKLGYKTVTNATSNLPLLADGIQKFVAGLSGISTGTTGMSTTIQQITDLSNAIARFGYKSVTNAITNLPLLAASLKQFMLTVSTAPNVSDNIIRMTSAMASLAAQGSKYNSTIKSMSSAANKLSESHTKATKSSTSFFASISKLVVGFYVLRRALTAALAPVNSAMDFGETVNLFQTSFKKIGMDAAVDSGMEWGSESANAYAKTFIDEAQTFNNRLVDALSLDPATIMNYQAMFASMANSIGLATGTVQNLSDSFTALGVDLASLYNLDIEEAMTKLKAGIAGETEPLRALGIDITEATLKMVALKYGIDDSVASMTYAEKTQLRYLAIMQQTQTAWGDMAKTLTSSKNQMRVLEQQWANLSRSIGNVFLPVITTVLPYVNGLVIALRQMVDTLATAMGYELPDYSDYTPYTDLTSATDGYTDSTDAANDATKSLQKTLAGFDKLNNQTSSAASSSAGTGTSGSGYSELDDVISQTTTSYMAKMNEELQNMSNKAKEFADKIKPMLEGFVEWIDKLSPLFVMVTTSIGAYAIMTFFVNLAAKIGALAFTPMGVIALAIGGIAAIYTAFKEYNEKLKQDDLEGRFGKIALSLAEIDEIADTLTTSKYTANIDIYISEKQKLSEIESDIQTDIETLNKLNWKISVGLGLTPEEQSTYKATIEKFVTDSEAYIEQQHYVAKLAIDAVINDTNFNAEISALVDEYYNGSKGEMAQLGKDLRSEMDNALADGIIDATEQKVIDNLVKEIAAINERVASAEFKAKLQMITIDGDLTPDSFKELTAKIQEIIGERTKQAEEANYTVLANVNAAYSVKMEDATTQAEKNAIQTEWDSSVKEITDNLSQTKANISFDGTQFSLDSLLTKYGNELDTVKTSIQDKTKTTFTTEIVAGIANADPSEGIKTLVNGMEWNYLTALDESGMSTATKDGLAEMLKGLEPSEEQYKKVYDDALKTGSQVPDGISAQLTDIEKMKALTGDRDAILYLIGQGMADSPEYLEMLLASETAGADLDQGIIDGLKSKLPDLQLQGTKLVFTVGKAIKDKSEAYEKDNMPRYGQKLIDGFKSAFDGDGSAVLSAKGWLAKIDEEIKNHKLPNVSLSTNLLLNISGIDTSDPLGILSGSNIKKYATGGQPNTGEMFVAREAGPEMVGRIGNHTTVANNDQIVDSVSQGVAVAVAGMNAEETALLRQQNSLLQAILERTGITTGDIFKSVLSENKSASKTGKTSLAYN